MGRYNPTKARRKLAKRREVLDLMPEIERRQRAEISEERLADEIVARLRALGEPPSPGVVAAITAVEQLAAPPSIASIAMSNDGLVRHAWATAGVRLPADWERWRTDLIPVAGGECLPGDIVTVGADTIHAAGIFISEGFVALAPSRVEYSAAMVAMSTGIAQTHRPDLSR